VTGVFQTDTHTIQSQNEIIANGTGEPITKIYFGQTETATFEYVATGTSGGLVPITYPNQSQVATVSDLSDTAIAGTTWLVDKVETKGSNTTSHRVTVDLWRAANITS
jgi:hypothetical protein